MNSRLSVAIVGTGPAGIYAALHLLEEHGINVAIDLFERLPTPWGLIRAGVAPDHPEKKSIVDRLFQHVLRRPEVRLFGNVEIGRDLTINELRRHYHAIIIASGANGDVALNIPGEQLPGSLSAREFVAWYNGHPDYHDMHVDLSSERAVIVGNGNVALDVARILTLPIDELEKTDIAEHALKALRASRLREVVILGRRGCEHAAYNTPELEELLYIRDVALRVEGETLPTADADWLVQRKLNVLHQLIRKPAHSATKTIVFHFLASPVALIGAEKVSALTLANNRIVVGADGKTQVCATDTTSTIPTGLVIRAVGYRGLPFAELPFDAQRAVIANSDGRVIDRDNVCRGVYVTGWIKRGPRGIIGSNKKCAQQTVAALLADWRAQQLPDVVTDMNDITALLLARGTQIVNKQQWLRIDRSEREAGHGTRRPRIKLVDIGQMLAVAR